jgi:acyl-CoA:acyl-CoA alkyltransferase
LIIQSIALETPSLKLSNDDLLDRIREANCTEPDSEVSDYCKRVGGLLAKTGAQTRYVRDRKNGETALGLVVQAARLALDRAGCKASDIDLLIYCGVAKGFVEPASATFVCRALGMSCDCFDVSEACMSWVRSLHIAHNYLATSAYSKILIVNGEFTSYEHSGEDMFRIRSKDELGYTFPAFTIGEAATATVLGPSRNQWKFRFRSDPSLAPLCTLPLPGFRDFGGPDERIGLNGCHRLTSFGQEMSAIGITRIVQFVRDTYSEPYRFDNWFPHAASAKACRVAARRLGLEDKAYYHGFPRFGNLVSASIPAAMALAIEEKKLQRGHRILLCPVSAGMSFALVEGEY